MRLCCRNGSWVDSPAVVLRHTGTAVHTESPTQQHQTDTSNSNQLTAYLSVNVRKLPPT